MTPNRLLPFIGIILILAGCSMEKRVYTRGYNLGWGGNNTGRTAKAGARKHHTNAITADRGRVYMNECTLTASDETASFVLPYGLPKINDATGDTCDIIQLKDNTLIRARVKEINLYYVIYKKCGDPDGPDYTVPKSTISQITFADGLLQSFNFAGETEPQPDTIYVEESPVNYERKEYPLAKHAVIAGGGSFIPIVGWVFAILGIVFGSISLNRIRSHPEKYTGEGKARAGLIMGIIGLVAGFIFAMLYYSEIMYY